MAKFTDLPAGSPALTDVLPFDALSGPTTKKATLSSIRTALMPIVLTADVGGLLPTANQSPQTMTGDVGGTTAANTITNLAVSKLAVSGTNGRVLTEVAGVATWAAASGASTPWHNVPRVTKTANYTITAADYLVVCLTNTGFSITLPVSPNDGDAYVIYNQAAGTNFVGGNGHNIGPSGTYSLAQYESVAVVWDNAETAWTLVASVKASSGGIAAPTGTGFGHSTAGSWDSASKKVDLSAAADVTGIAALGNGGTGLAAVPGSVSGTPIINSSAAYGAATNAVFGSGTLALGANASTIGTLRVAGVSQVVLSGRYNSTTDYPLISFNAGMRVQIGADDLGNGTYPAGLDFNTATGTPFRFIVAGGTLPLTLDSAGLYIVGPIIGNATYTSPHSVHGKTTVATTGSFSLAAADYALDAIMLSGGTAGTVTFPAATDAKAYYKTIINTSGVTKTLSNGGATTVTIATGNVGRYLFDAAGVHMLSVVAWV